MRRYLTLMVVLVMGVFGLHIIQPAAEILCIELNCIK